MDDRLSDTDARSLLWEARKILGSEQCETVHAGTAMLAARKALEELSLGIMAIQAQDAGVEETKSEKSQTRLGKPHLSIVEPQA